MRYQAYITANSAVEKPTQTEYRLFAEITRELEQAMSDTAPAKHRIAAAFRNSQLWLTLKTDLMSESNKLDTELKAGLISLAIWVEKQSLQAINGATDLTPLIDINKDIMQGLSQSSRPKRSGSSDISEIETPPLRHAIA
ncbi:MAG: flagellar biosynthesis regulator FlaF [Sneathiella sp.]|nr:flagellar biosynthesis regulator FlaF [Sneathiella sp.]